MAMLVLPEVFQRTWGVAPEPFWPKATAAVRRAHPAFTFMAEVYWDLEWTLQQQGFDYCYDKGSMIGCSPATSDPSANTFAPVSTSKTSSPDSWRTTTSPAPRPHSNGRGIAQRRRSLSSPQALRFFHQGQFEGARLRVPVHLCRGPAEPTDQELAAFYGKLLQILRDTDFFRNGDWFQIDPLPAWPGNFSSEGFVSYAWAGRDEGRYVAVVNYAENRGQCYLRLPFPELIERQQRISRVLTRPCWQAFFDVPNGAESYVAARPRGLTAAGAGATCADSDDLPLP